MPLCSLTVTWPIPSHPTGSAGQRSSDHLTLTILGHADNAFASIPYARVLLSEPHEMASRARHGPLCMLQGLDLMIHPSPSRAAAIETSSVSVPFILCSDTRWSQTSCCSYLMLLSALIYQCSWLLMTLAAGAPRLSRDTMLSTCLRALQSKLPEVPRGTTVQD